MRTNILIFLSLGILLALDSLSIPRVSGVFWNPKPKVTRVRPRPPRHPILNSESHSIPHHRIHHAPHGSNVGNHLRVPSPIVGSHTFLHHVPIKSYRPPSSPHQGQSNSHSHKNLLTHLNPAHLLQTLHKLKSPLHKLHSHHLGGGGTRGPHSHFKPDDSPSKVKKGHHSRPKDSQSSSPRPKNPFLGSNQISSSDFKPISTDGNGQQHGYMSSDYKGWRPIWKPEEHVKGGQHPGGPTYPYYSYPTTDSYADVDGKHRQLALKTLFRDEVRHLKPLKPVKLKPDYSEVRGVSISFGPDPKGYSSSSPPQQSLGLPSSPTLFHTSPSNNQLYFLSSSPSTTNYQVASTTTTEEKSVGPRKPFPPYPVKIIKNNRTVTLGTNPSGGGGDPSGSAPTSLGSPTSKFKISRPKLRPPTLSQQQSQQSHVQEGGDQPGSGGPLSSLNPNNNNNEPEIEGPHKPSSTPTFPSLRPFRLHEANNGGPSLSFKDKIKVRTPARVTGASGSIPSAPEGYVNAEELGKVFSSYQVGPSGTGPSGSSQPILSRIPGTGPSPKAQRPLVQEESNNSRLPGPTNFDEGRNGFIVSRYPTDFNHGPTNNNDHRYIEPTYLTELKGNSITGDNQNQNSLESGGGPRSEERPRKRRPRPGHKRPPPSPNPPLQHSTPSSTENSGSGYEGPPQYSTPQFFLPELPQGFMEAPPHGGQNHHPVSFMTMPGSAPRVIHHHQAPQPHYQQHHYVPLQDPRTESPGGTSSQGPPAEPHRVRLYPINITPNSGFGSEPPSTTPLVTHGPSSNRPHFVFMNIQNGELQPVPAPHHHQSQASLRPPLPTSVTPVYYEPSRKPGYPIYRAPEESQSSYYRFAPAPTHGPTGSTTTPRALVPYGTYLYSPGPPQGHTGNSLEGQRDHGQYRPPIEGHYIEEERPLQAFASTEFEQIPMEFMSELRPILLEDGDELTPGGGHLQIPSSTSSSNEVDYSQLGSPLHFIQNLFKPMSESPINYYRGRDPQDHHTFTPSAYPLNRPSSNDHSQGYYEPVKASSAPQAQILKPHFSPSTPDPAPDNFLHPDDESSVSNSPIQEYSLVTTISPIHDIEIFTPSRKQVYTKLWSKLRSTPTTEDTPILSSTHRYRKVQRTTEGTSSTEEFGKSSTQNSTVSNSTESTTNKNGLTPETSSFSSLRSKIRIKGNDSKETLAYMNPTPLVLFSPGHRVGFGVSSSDPEPPSDPSPSRTLRTRGTTTSTSTTTPSPIAITTGRGRRRHVTRTPGTGPSWRRPILRRRRPGFMGVMGRRRFLSSSQRPLQTGEDGDEGPPVTTHRPRRPFLTSSATERLVHLGDSSFESSKLNHIKSRRRIIIPTASEERTESEGSTEYIRRPLRLRSTTTTEKPSPTSTTTTTSTSTSPPPVQTSPETTSEGTYDESKWFQVKDAGSLDSLHHNSVVKSSKGEGESSENSPPEPSSPDPEDPAEKTLSSRIGVVGLDESLFRAPGVDETQEEIGVESHEGFHIPRPRSLEDTYL